jgi:hypothetical protein
MEIHPVQGDSPNTPSGKAVFESNVGGYWRHLLAMHADHRYRTRQHLVDLLRRSWLGKYSNSRSVQRRPSFQEKTLAPL